MNPIEYIGFAAGAISVCSLIPEIIQASKTHRLKDVAWGMLFLMFCSSLLWNIYAVFNDVTPLFISSLIHLVLQLVLISLKFIYEHRQSPLFPDKKPLTQKIEADINE